MTSCSGTEDTPSTVDEVFLLSDEEVQRYLPSEACRRTVATPYVIGRGGFVKSGSGYCWWWLRTPGRDTEHSAYVYSYGVIDTKGDVVTSSAGGVRPAIWVKID
jgi:hypothetical protein